MHSHRFSWFVSTFLCCILVVSAASLPSYAVDTPTVKIVSYNVSGIPVVGDGQGTSNLRGGKRAAAIGRILNGLNADIIGVQEDFNSHDSLAAEVSSFPYQTYTSGKVPLGDGMNIFSKTPIYNIERIKWNKSYGVLSGSADKLARKGIVCSVVKLSEEVYIDFYVIHADAGRDKSSVAARGDNFRQLSALINSRPVDRPLIVIGDFNSNLDRDTSDDMRNNLIKSAGLKDAWAELYNGGSYDYNGGEGWNPSFPESIDRVMYRDGNGITLTPESLEYVVYTDGEGNTYTDHMATVAVLSYAVTGEVSDESATLTPPAPFDAAQRRTDEFMALVSTFFLAVFSLHELFYLLGQLGEAFGYYPKY